MHLLEAYAVVAGCLIDKPFIRSDPIALPKQPFLTFHGFNPKGQTRQYSKWQLVIDDLLNDSNFNYEIIQIGGINDYKYNNINTSYLGLTNYNTLAYLIQHCSLHFGFDSLPIHIASYYDKKIVGLYAHYSQNTGPYFSSPNNVILLEPDHKNIKPVFNEEDPLHRIDTIDHKIISYSIEKLLNNE